MSNEDLSDEESSGCDDDFYYQDDFYNMDDVDERPASHSELESFKYEVLSLEKVELLLNESVEELSKAIKVDPSLAKLLLQMNRWSVPTVVDRYKRDPGLLLHEARIFPHVPSQNNNYSTGFASSSSFQPTFEVKSVNYVDLKSSTSTRGTCDVCMVESIPGDQNSALHGLLCKHEYCLNCWQSFLVQQLEMGRATEIECMGDNCKLRAHEKFVLNILAGSPLREKYNRFAFRDLVQSHPQLRFCPGANCPVVIRAAEPRAKRVKCHECSAEYCFQCGLEYHAPMDCHMIQLWLTKCRDDSETANYISANTKDCPKCHVCIEKNGGCNHMLCCKCKYEFCWMCLGDWKSHQAEYYECSRYKENPNIANESQNVQARAALKKYLFYFERWHNHEKSLRLEDEQLAKIRARIHAKVMSKEGTWIDWQHLLTAAEVLRKCRYTLKYTYPYAYYMTKKQMKELFEYQQGSLESEVENLSWMIQRADIYNRGYLENKMDVCEKQRLSLLHEFFSS